MMTPEEIKRIREWARKGNNPIPIEDLGSLYYANVWTNERPFFVCNGALVEQVGGGTVCSQCGAENGGKKP